MTTMDYLINAGFVFMVCMQARERRLDRRVLVIPLVLVFFVAQQYVHRIPVAGNDLVLIGCSRAPDCRSAF
jgi:predicted benzoate:H+ symporter BenE